MEMAFAAMMGWCGTKWPGWWRGPRPPQPDPWWWIVSLAGVLVAGNLQRSHFGAKSLDANVDFFAIAAPSSDHVYGPAGEDPATRVLTWPLTSGVWLKKTVSYGPEAGWVRVNWTSELKGA